MRRGDFEDYALASTVAAAESGDSVDHDHDDGDELDDADDSDDDIIIEEQNTGSETVDANIETYAPITEYLVRRLSLNISRRNSVLIGFPVGDLRPSVRLTAKVFRFGIASTARGSHRLFLPSS